MITLNAPTTLVALAAAASLLVGCSGSNGTDTGVSTSSAASNSGGAPQMSDQQAPPNRLVVDVTIKGGQVAPTNAQLTSSAGEPIVIRINSDTADQLHVNSNPEHSFTVEPKSGQSFQFTVTDPGKVDVQLRQLNTTIATIQVQ